MPRRITTILIAFGLLFGLALWRPGSKVKVKAAPNAGGRSEVGNYSLAGTWKMTANLNVARSFHTATLLPNGKVLVYGGYSGNGASGVALNSAELFDPATESWSLTGSTFYQRYGHTATLLPNGRVLVAGGNPGARATELYDPAVGQWYSTGPLQIERSSHTATLLPNGKVLVAGGWNNITGYTTTAELYDPVTQVWTLTGNLNAGRSGHTANLLPDGKVLVMGGNSAELYDPATGIWTPTGGLFYYRTSDMYRTTSLQDGRVVVTGGYHNDSIGSSLRAVEMYIPNLGNWYTVGPLQTARRYHAATLLPNGKALVAGGMEKNAGGYFHLISAEVFDPATLVWTPTFNLNVARSYHTLTLLPNGNVLAAGGDNATTYSHSLDSAELFDSAAACSAITVYPATLPPITTGTAYSQTFEQSGSSGTVVWGISAGALPDGLTLNAASGLLSGIPTVSTYDFTVRATNGNCFGQRAYTSVVKAVSTTTLSASANPVASGELLTLTARVSSPSGGTPTGTVRFRLARLRFSGPIPLVNGIASLDTFAPEASEPGNFLISAIYSGDGDYKPSSGSLTLEVY